MAEGSGNFGNGRRGACPTTKNGIHARCADDALNSGPMNRLRAFTLIEIVMAVFILMLLLLLAVPSMSGVFADKRLRRSLDGLNDLVRQAREHSLIEHRAYLMTWAEGGISLQPEAFANGEEKKPVAKLAFNRGESWRLVLPTALAKDPPPEWIFWPSGACEAARVEFNGRDGRWTAAYSPVTARAEIISYVAK